MLVLVTYLVTWLAVVSSWILKSRQPHNDIMVSSGRGSSVRGRCMCIVLTCCFIVTVLLRYLKKLAMFWMLLVNGVSFSFYCFS